jgi:Tfp pilus assembly protein FimT
MIIAGILAGAAVVTLSNTTGNRSTMAAKQLLRDLTFARQRAVATGTQSWVVFDTNNHKWSLLVEDPAVGTRASATALTDPATGQDFVQQLDASQFVGVQLDTMDFENEVELGFDWQGKPWKYDGAVESSLGATGTVTVTGGQGVSVEIDSGHIAYTP